MAHEHTSATTPTPASTAPVRTGSTDMTTHIPNTSGVGGGMGSVFLAHDTHVNNKPVVIKEMVNVYATEAERREAEAEF